MELVDLGIFGTMPGLGMADLLQKTWLLAKSGAKEEAWTVYERILPQIVFSLQNFELFARMDKNLLSQRGVIPAESTYVRSATYTPDAHSWEYGVNLNSRIVEFAKQRTQA